MSMLANLALASSILTSNVSTNLNTMNIPTNYDPGLIVETNLRTNSSSTYSDYVDSYINQELYSKGNATVTILTHGMAGNSYDWLTKTENSYDTDSTYILPFSINDSLNYTGYFENDILKTNIFRFSYNSISNSTILDRLVKDNTGNYSFNSNETINEIDIESHIILLYDGDLGSEDRLVTNNECYKLFEESLDTILVGISLFQEDTLPKINLIGHSRGGLVNLEYAIKHKEIISNLISLGTPYSNGTKLAQSKNYIYDDWASFYNNIQKTKEDFVSGYDDMLDNFTFKDQFNSCKDKFNSYAIGFNQSYFYCLNTIISYFTKDNCWLNNFTQNLSNYTNNFISKEQFENILKELLNLLNDSNLKNFIKNFFEGAQNATDFVSFFANIFNSTDLENKCQKANKIFSDLCSIVSNDVFCKDENKDSIIQSDICVNLDSQLGLTRTEDIYTKLNTPINSENYLFTKRDIITFDSLNHYEEKYTSQNNYWVAHNFETKNPDAISLIINYLTSNNNLHNHKFKWNYNSSYHYKICDCGTYKYSNVNHSLKYTFSTSERHTFKCNTCGYTIEKGHTNKYVSISTSSHKKVCSSCGYTMCEEHLYSLYRTTGANHTSYCICGKQGSTGKHVINNITGRCVVCNMEILVVSPITPPVITPNPGITPDINY